MRSHTARLLPLPLLCISALGTLKAEPPQAFFARYCTSCHNQKLRTANLLLDTADLNRIPQGAELTAAGRAFHELVCTIPDQVDRARQSALRAARGEFGSLAIGYTNSSALNPVFVAAMRSYRRAYPDDCHDLPGTRGADRRNVIAAVAAA